MSKELTEKWKKRELALGSYYVKDASGRVFIDEYIKIVYGDDVEPTVFRYEDVIVEVVAGVPTCAEFKDLMSNLQYIDKCRELTEKANQFSQMVKKVDELEKEKAELLKKIDELNKQIDVLKKQIESLEKENELLEEKANLKLPKDAEDIKYLVERDLILKKLEFWGVDNWGGYEDAINWVFTTREDLK